MFYRERDWQKLSHKFSRRQEGTEQVQKEIPGPKKTNQNRHSFTVTWISEPIQTVSLRKTCWWLVIQTKRTHLMVNEVVTEISIGNKNLKHLMSVHDLFRTQFSVSRNHYETLKSILYYQRFWDKSVGFLDSIWTVPLNIQQQNPNIMTISDVFCLEI